MIFVFYAIKACAKFGGSPVVYVVNPDQNSLSAKTDAEFTCNFADIVGRL